MQRSLALATNYIIKRSLGPSPDTTNIALRLAQPFQLRRKLVAVDIPQERKEISPPMSVEPLGLLPLLVREIRLDRVPLHGLELLADRQCLRCGYVTSKRHIRRRARNDLPEPLRPPECVNDRGVSRRISRDRRKRAV